MAEAELFNYFEYAYFREVKKFIEESIHKININEQDYEGRTFLFWAILRPWKPIVKILLEKGADPNITTFEDRTPLEEAVELNDFELVHLLIENGADVKDGFPLHFASQHNNLNIVKLLIEKGVDINKRYKGHGNALTYYCKYIYLDFDIIKYLIEKGIDVNVRNNLGQTPLCEVSLYDNLHLVKFLLQNGANKEIKDRFGRKPIDITENPKIKKYILDFDKIKRGPELMALFQINSLPLELAAEIAEFDTPETGFIGKKIFTDILMNRHLK